MEFSPTLKDLGLSDKEIKVYLSLIENGAQPVRGLAQKTAINRGTVYDSLKSLIQQGLVSYYHQKTHQYFVAEEPDKLISVIENKKQQLNEVSAKITDLIPELKSVYENADQKPTVKLYENFSGLKQVLQDVLAVTSKLVENEYYALSSADIRNYLYKAFPNYNQQRLKNKTKVKTISLGAGGTLSGLDERKWLTESHGSPSYIIIYGDRVAMFSLNKEKRPIAVIMEDAALAQTQKMIFEFIWKKI